MIPLHSAAERIHLTFQSGKKLKKRLEDLEARARSSSGSPEQRHEELAQPEPVSEHATPIGNQRQRSGSNHIRGDRTPETVHQHYVLPSDDRSMFSQQYTRQMSTSPPPFSYGTIPSTETTAYSTYPQPGSYCAMPGTMDMQYYPQYLPPIQQSYQHIVPSMTTPPIKQEYYHDDEMSPFSMSYATMAGVDVHTAQSYPEIAAYVCKPPYNRSHSYPQWPTNSG